MSRLYSYVLKHDTGFAPNPYHGFCTLACCKPRIRERAEIGDWIIGTGSSAKGKDRGGHISYAMQVTDVLTFDQYWNDERFLAKRPDLNGNLEEACGDNMHYLADGQFCRIPGYHCGSDKIEDDVYVDRVLVSDDFVYWGGDGPPLPEFRGHNLCKKGPAHKVNFPQTVVEDFVSWIRGIQRGGDSGVCGSPLDRELSERTRRKAKRGTSPTE